MSELDVQAASFRTSRLPAVAVDDAIDPSIVRQTREAAAHVTFEGFDLAHRGRYAFSTEPIPPAALEALVDVASRCSGEVLSVTAHRYVRLRCGDYVLARDDESFCAAVAPHAIDLSLDLSVDLTCEAEVVFTHRSQAFFTVPQRPGVVGIVRRMPTVGRYERYLTHRVGALEVVRLRLVLSSDRG
ncbi:MAG: hypothetical protein HOW73_45110 [Polyangiaceae bacterium]|nr:hypothetical protein [Polyangiaceae bacterium]